MIFVVFLLYIVGAACNININIKYIKREDTIVPPKYYSISPPTFSPQQLEEERANNQANIEAFEQIKKKILQDFGQELYDIIYPEYTYCPTITDETECLGIEGCSWCNWPTSHCQYVYVAELYPIADYCIDGVEDESYNS